MSALHTYLPQDRLRALARGETLPDRTTGAALFADISGFTLLTEALRDSLGPRRGAEDLTRHLDTVYTALITQVEQYGGSVIGRSELLREVIEGIERWIGSHFTVGVRLNAEEFTPGGLNMQDARLLATRLVSAGVRLLEIQAQAATDMPIAHFPGWCVPMAAGIKAVVDIPVMVGGLLDDPELADSVIRDGGADLISVGARMRVEPDWPHHARAILAQREMFLD